MSRCLTEVKKMLEELQTASVANGLKINAYTIWLHGINLGKETRNCGLDDIQKTEFHLQKPGCERKVYNTCVLPIKSCGLEGIMLTIKNTNKFQTTKEKVNAKC